MGAGGGDEATSGISAGTTWLAWDLGRWDHVAGLGPGRVGVCSMGHDRETDRFREGHGSFSKDELSLKDLRAAPK